MLNMDLITIIWYIVIAAASTTVYLLRKNLSYWKNLGIPHDDPHVLVGNMKGLRSTQHFAEIIAKYYHKFKGTGPFAGIFIGQRPGAVLLDREAIKQVLIKDFTNFTDRGMYYNEKSDPITGNLFFVDGERWRILRNKMSPTLTSGKIKNMYPILLNVSNELINVLNEKVKVNPVLEVRDLLGRFTIDIIASTALGIDCQCMRNPNDRFLEFGRKSSEKQRHNFFIMNCIDSFPRLSRMLGMRIIPEDVHQFFMKTVTETVEYREKHQIQRNDFLNMLIELKNNGDDKSGLSIEEVTAQVFIFFLGGFETSSSTMSYALYELAQNQEVQDRLREEIVEAFERENLEITYEAIMNLPYLDQVLSETLRKYPIAPILHRQAVNDYIFRSHPKYVLKKGTPVFIPVMGIQHDPEFYPNPEEFDPERFSPEMVKQRNPMEWLPFGDGPRNCIGMRFGKLQSCLGLASIIRHFRFTVCSATEIPLRFDTKSMGLSPRNNVYLNVEAI